MEYKIVGIWAEHSGLICNLPYERMTFDFIFIAQSLKQTKIRSKNANTMNALYDTDGVLPWY